MPGAAERSEFRLEGAHLRSKDKLTVTQYAGDRCIDSRTEPPTLGGDVNEGNRHRISAQIHRMPVDGPTVTQRPRAALSVAQA
jgi:hypothetical protein